MSLAAALKKSGATVNIIEKQPDRDVLGVGISLQLPALPALKTIGLLESCVHDGFGYSQLVNCDQNGRAEGVVELKSPSEPGKTGEDACPTSPNQEFTSRVGQASWPVGSFFN